ncbi:MAG: hypothetical protein QNK43_09930 [Amphritea sp.]|nr:hypothetical protein [Amphritea sp.]
MPPKTYTHESLDSADLTLNSILDLIVEGIWDWHGETGNVVHSPSWYRMLDYSVGGLSDVVLKLQSVIAATTFVNNIHLECSFGAVEYQQNEAMAELFQRVDHAMYETSGLSVSAGCSVDLAWSS